MSGPYVIERSALGLELRREPTVTFAGQSRKSLARMTITLDGEPLSAVLLGAEELKRLSTRAAELARELEHESAEEPR